MKSAVGEAWFWNFDEFCVAVSAAVDSTAPAVPNNTAPSGIIFAFIEAHEMSYIFHVQYANEVIVTSLSLSKRSRHRLL